jgi:transposase
MVTDAQVRQLRRRIMEKKTQEATAAASGMSVRLFELTADLNSRMMRTYKASRRELFERLDRPALAALPEQPYEASTWKQVRLNIDYHADFEGHFYSAPHALRHEDVELWLRATTTTIEIFHGRERVAAHVRSYVRGGFTTNPEHMPSTHRAHAEWRPSRILAWADSIGPQTRALCEVILRERHHPEWGYRSCLGLFRLAKKYEHTRVEAACARALFAGAKSYRPVKTILQHGLDGRPLPAPESAATAGITHENVRGRDYYH